MERCMKLKGKVVAITGAAQGLGQALAQRCGEEGAQVVVGDMNLEGAQETARMLPDAIAMKLDVTDFADCEAFAAAAIEKYGRIDVLVSNAGIVISGAIGEFNPDTWKKVIDVNLCGFFNVAKAVVPAFRKQRSGVIVQINSKSGKKGSAKNSAYASSKFGGIGLVESLALELAAENIRVNAICPGNMLDSPLWVNSLYKQYAKNQGITEAEVRKKYEAQVPLGRGCSYEDIANCMIFLASEDSSYMTGQAINVTGGQQMQP
ncbi:MAG: SDR family oxidoreductase [Christensenella hongkongensis]|uniref:SDR family NAD(P)-dependent oxidoreductase n=1 Tax=Christensenella hongkongensis TaxID=270498 RepID=UPI002A75554D|nr:SDR family NAD(P)-dependent oxidoreductase [Christensenella hongkongensis]MDY3003745.1 SDR family oxidoreductase [Christensenella hongkongensis]